MTSRSALGRLIAEGTVTPSSEPGMPDLMEDLLPEVHSVADVLMQERDDSRRGTPEPGTSSRTHA